jgi:hypothetical protein
MHSSRWKRRNEAEFPAGRQSARERLLWLAGLLGLLPIGVAVNAALHGDGIDPVATAADQTASMPGAHCP